MRALVLAGAVAALAFAGLAAKAAPVDLSGGDLDRVTAGGYGFPPIDLELYKNVRVNAVKNIAVRALVQSLPVVQGNLAEAEAFGTAIGKGSFTQTLTSGEAVQDLYSRSASESVAAANHPYFYHGGGGGKGGCDC